MSLDYMDSHIFDYVLKKSGLELLLEKKDRDLDKSDLRPVAKAYKRCDGQRVHHQTDPVRDGISI